MCVCGVCECLCVGGVWGVCVFVCVCVLVFPKPIIGFKRDLVQ